MKKWLPLLLSLSLSGSVWAQADTGNLSYSLGVLLGQSVGNTGLDVNLDDLVRGMKAAMAPATRSNIDYQAAQTMVQAALQDAQDKKDEAALAAEAAYLKTHGALKGVKTTASGLQIETLVAGTGASPVESDTVKVDYVGSLTDGTEFDSSIKRGEPAVFPLAQVIPGWTEGLQLMKVGGKYRITVPSALAYGPQGAGNGAIPAYATLVFEVQLLSIEPPEAAEEQ